MYLMKTFKRILRFLPMVIMMVVIFCFSQMKGDDSGETSGKLLTEILKLVKSIQNKDLSQSTIDSIHFFIRKAAHFTEYAIFGWSTIYALTGLVKNKWAACIFSEAFVFVYAISDEIHQYLVPGRYMSAMDVGIDSLGALFGIWIFVLFHRNKKKKKQSKEQQSVTR